MSFAPVTSPSTTSSASQSAHSSTSSTASLLSAASAHLLSVLHVDESKYDVTPLLDRLSQAQCHPLSEERALQLKEVETKSAEVRRIAKMFADENAKTSVSAASAPAVVSLDSTEVRDREKILETPNASKTEDAPLHLCDFEPAGVLIFDLTASPVCEVTSIRAFDLEWQPVGPRKIYVESATPSTSAVSNSSERNEFIRAAGLTIMNPSTVSSSATHSLVQFVSRQRASYAAPSSAELSHHQCLKQLPKAIESNAHALKNAEDAGELADIGALYLEGKRLKGELQRMQNEPSVMANVVEVGATFQLPLGPVIVDGRRYFLHRDEAGQVCNRGVEVVLVYTADGFKVPTECHLTPGSGILTTRHTPALLHLFNKKHPHMVLLFSSKRDGNSAVDFHRLCDGKGPTLIVIRTSSRGREDAFVPHIIGAWAEQSWNSGVFKVASRTWLFSLGYANGNSQPVAAKYQPVDEAHNVISSTSYSGPMFGLSPSRGFCVSFHAGISADLHGYQLSDGFHEPPLPLGGGEFWDAECMEVWTCPLVDSCD